MPVCVICICVCIFTCVYMGICTHMWTPEVDVEHLLQLLFALYINADPSPKLGLEVSESLLSCLFLGLRVCFPLAGTTDGI